MFDTFTAVLDWFGIVVFATTGALVASRKQMDVVGFVLLGTVTGVGGGTLRVTCVIVSAAVFGIAHMPASRYRLLLWCDAVGMAIFAVTGAEKALLAGADAVVAIAMGVVTGTFGGIVRDVLGGESPVILRREIYATAALAGATLFVALSALGLAREAGLASGFALATAIRFAALRWNWSLPRYRSRPGRTPEEIERPRSGR